MLGLENPLEQPLPRHPPPTDSSYQSLADTWENTEHHGLRKCLLIV